MGTPNAVSDKRLAHLLTQTTGECPVLIGIMQGVHEMLQRAIPRQGSTHRRNLEQCNACRDFFSLQGESAGRTTPAGGGSAADTCYPFDLAGSVFSLPSFHTTTCHGAFPDRPTTPKRQVGCLPGTLRGMPPRRGERIFESARFEPHSWGERLEIPHEEAPIISLKSSSNGRRSNG